MQNPVNNYHSCLNHIENQIIFNNKIAIAHLHEIGIIRHSAHARMASQIVQAFFNFICQGQRGVRIIGGNKGDRFREIFLCHAQEADSKLG